jgi:lipooligosaccharide transport system ATP-binding protein
MAQTAKLVVRAQDLEKTFGQLSAVSGLSFGVEAGQCVGLLGPNGAGKTTTMRMLMGLTRVTRGSLEVFEVPVAALARERRGRIGLVPQEDTLDPDLSVQQNLEVYGSYFGLAPELVHKRVLTLLEFMQLGERADDTVMQLSGGMRRRLVIARALIADPDLVILDEPTTGLDPQARVLIWKQLTKLQRQGKTLLLTTHYMDEAQRLCDYIIIIDQGRVLAEGNPQALIDEYVKGHVFELRKPLSEALSLDQLDHEDIGDALVVYVEHADEFTTAIPGGTEYRHRQANLEDVFLRLTGRALRDF